METDSSSVCSGTTDGEPNLASHTGVALAADGEEDGAVDGVMLDESSLEDEKAPELSQSPTNSNLVEAELKRQQAPGDGRDRGEAPDDAGLANDELERAVGQVEHGASERFAAADAEQEGENASNTVGEPAPALDGGVGETNPSGSVPDLAAQVTAPMTEENGNADAVKDPLSHPTIADDAQARSEARSLLAPTQTGSFVTW